MEATLSLLSVRDCMHHTPMPCYAVISALQDLLFSAFSRSEHTVRTVVEPRPRSIP